MNDTNEPSEEPTQEPPVATPPQKRPPALPADAFTRMAGSKGALGVLEALLKYPEELYTEVREGERGKVVLGLSVVCLVSLFAYGLIAGCFSGGQQIWQAPLKIAIGLTVSGLICLPSLYIFTCLGRVDVTFSEVLCFLVAMMTMASVMLVGLAPVLFVFTMSTESVVFMGVMHLAIWGVAAYFGNRFFIMLFTFLTGRRNEHGYMQLWIVILTFVVLQMSTALRPIIGSDDQAFTTEKKFFAVHWIEQLDL